MEHMSACPSLSALGTSFTGFSFAFEPILEYLSRLTDYARKSNRASIGLYRERNLRLDDHRDGAPVRIADRSLPHRRRAADVQGNTHGAKQWSLGRGEEVGFRLYGSAAIACGAVSDRAWRTHDICHSHHD